MTINIGTTYVLVSEHDISSVKILYCTLSLLYIIRDKRENICNNGY